MLPLTNCDAPQVCHGQKMVSKLKQWLLTIPLYPLFSQDSDGMRWMTIPPYPM